MIYNTNDSNQGSSIEFHEFKSYIDNMLNDFWQIVRVRLCLDKVENSNITK